MSDVIAIDPGPIVSAFLYWDGDQVKYSSTEDNEVLLNRFRLGQFNGASKVAIEMVACYGMAVGKEVFDTCVWIGRFMERAPIGTVKLVYRHEVKMHLCHSMRAKDANIRQALIDKHGAPGTKKNPGKTYGISGHLWAALAIADYVASTATDSASHQRR